MFARFLLNIFPEDGLVDEDAVFFLSAYFEKKYRSWKIGAENTLLSCSILLDIKLFSK